ncbi:hypothetical protein DERP_000198 [Dermatophagoides pteronyssinus]|uniref:Uncharacterized protein n=2 Tax=Dermatophagoides pteronyssinus TaxID=6956 RepID=A0ABQ8IZJ4_DERPT|nr:androgen-induced gene 1 protein-like [Dermatophagoides pteronyssinus]KAH9415708.1 hypothetical protein DERP_000198 [Dermatophagoides pteronyssinus]
MAEKFVTIVRILSFLIYLFSIYWQYIVQPPFLSPERKLFGPLIYLTYWDLLLQTGFFFLLLINQLFDSRRLKNFIDLIFYALALPISWIVSSSFWILWAIDRELVLPASMDPYYPPWLNHSTHTMIAILTIMELFVGKHKPPQTRKGFFIFFTFVITYAIWSLYLRMAMGFWVYPFLDQMNSTFVTLFYISSLFLYSMTYFVSLFCGKYLCNNNQDHRPVKQRKNR